MRSTRALLLTWPFLLVACGSGGADDGVDVSGVLRQTGGPPGVSQPGVPGTVTFRAEDRSYAAEAARNGAFSLRLPPGTYEVEGRSPTYGGGQGICRTDAVRVAAQPVADVVVACTRR